MQKEFASKQIIYTMVYWFLEGTRDSEYHLVYRRSPEAKPSPYTDIGRYLSKDLAKLPDSTIRIPRSN